MGEHGELSATFCAANKPPFTKSRSMQPGPPSTPQAKVTLVTLATAWGPRFGGINAFNVEMTRSLGIHPDRVCDLICVVPQASTADFDDARRHSVTLLVLVEGGSGPGELPASLAPTVLRRLQSMQPQTSAFVWLGHDDKTGPLALALRAMALGSKAALVHHMAFGAYQHHKKGDSAAAQTKREAQRAMFQQADLCLAVGPMLQDQLVDLMSGRPHAPPVAMLVPGLAEPDPDHVSLGQAPPKNFTAFLGGRLGSDDDRIKQALLGVRGFGHAVGQAFQGGQAHAIRNAPTLRMRGVPADQHADVSKACSAAAQGQVINFDLQDYTEDRNAYFADLATSSVALMPSWHEGFGLTAWEAIACQVPVVLGEQSGVYRLLRDQCQGAGIGRSVRAVPVQGRATGDDSAAPHTDQDVAAVGDALRGIGSQMAVNKANAVQLATILRVNHDFTWKRCAADLAGAAQQHLGVTLFEKRKAHVGSPQPAASAQPAAAALNVPAFLQIPQPLVWRADHGAAPSALLVARHRVVRFDKARDPLVNQWLATLNSTINPLSLRLVTGPGGTGKTRSALELLARASGSSNGSGWTGLWMPADLRADALSQWQTFLATARGKFLLVVDYAEGRQTQLLQWLKAAHEATANPAAKSGELRLHVLCLARRGEWWNELHRSDACATEVAGLLTGTANLGFAAMPDWPADETARRVTYEDALTDYAVAQGLNRPTNAWLPELGAAPYDRPLYIHLAALAALAGERPAHAQALLSAQINREWRHWRQQVGGAVQDEVRYADWADAMAWLALAQGAPVASLAPALTSLQISTPGLQAGLVKAYGSDAETLMPLQPDLLAEALVVEQLAGKRGAAVLDLVFLADEGTLIRALEFVARLGARVKTADLEAELRQPMWASRLLQGLSRTWPVKGNWLVAAAHGLGHELGKWLLPSLRLLSASAQVQVSGWLVLPRYSTPLLTLAAQLARIRTGLALAPADHASALNDLAVRLRDLGGAEAQAEGLQAARDALSIRRELVRQQPATSLPDLAMSLNNVATRLSERGDAQSRVEAIQMAREASEVRRELARQKSSVNLLDLAMSLSNLAVHLSQQGDTCARPEVLRLAREAVGICRELARRQRVSYLPELAISLNNLANHLSEEVDSESRAEGLRVAREAVEIRRELAKRQPATYLPNLAMSLSNLGIALSKQGSVDSIDEAQLLARESVVAYRELAKQQPGAYLPGLAMSLYNLAIRLSEKSDTKSRTEALSVAREAVAVYRELTKQQPAAYLPDLATSLASLSNRLSEHGHPNSRAEGLRVARDALAIRRALVEEQSRSYLPVLAMSIRSVATRLFEEEGAEARAEALTLAREAAIMCRVLAKEQPVAHLPGLARSIKALLSGLLEEGEADSRAELLRLAREAVVVHRELAEMQPTYWLPDLAASLNNFANFLSEQSDAESRTEALSVARQAVLCFAVLNSKVPGTFERNFKIASHTMVRIADAQGLNGKDEWQRLINQLQRRSGE
jgi:hypothetical protein